MRSPFTPISFLHTQPLLDVLVTNSWEFCHLWWWLFLLGFFGSQFRSQFTPFFCDSYHCDIYFSGLSFFLSFFFFLFRATPVAYGSYQTGGWIRAIAASLRHSYSNSNSRSELHLDLYHNTRSLTHWVRSGVELASSWILVGLIIHWAIAGTPYFSVL